MKLRTLTTTRRRVRLFVVVAVSTAGAALPTAAQAFNPQPDPPGRAIGLHAAFNPQPDPPGRS